MQSAVRSSVESIWGLHMESPFVKGLNRYPQPLSPFWYFLETNLLVLHKVGCGKQRTIHIYLNHRYSKSIQKLIYITFVQHYMNPIYWNWPFFGEKRTLLHWWILKPCLPFPCLHPVKPPVLVWCFLVPTCWKGAPNTESQEVSPWQPRLVAVHPPNLGGLKTPRGVLGRLGEWTQRCFCFWGILEWCLFFDFVRMDGFMNN